MILRLILGDQLNRQHSWFGHARHDVHYLMLEMRQETDYVVHHLQKVVAFFAAMRAFAQWLQDTGHQVHYYTLDDAANTQSLPGMLEYIMKHLGITRFEYQQPDEWRLDEQLKRFSEQLDVSVQRVSSEHFLSTPEAFARLFQGKKQYLMERFYRHMRQQHGVLLDAAGKPLGGRWNYDAENRNKWPKNHTPPQARLFQNPVKAIKTMVQQSGVRVMGNFDGDTLLWPINPGQARELLHYFLEHLLPRFGRYQDAMTPVHWALYHSRLSFAMNSKMLSPKEVIDAAVAYYLAHPDTVGLAQVEGFVRQILGWREYMRNIYFLHMPEYGQHNFFNHQRRLPAFYWTGQTRMHCLRHSIGQSLQYAYAHHIQRLMVTGNFALLAGVHPDEVDAWYLGVYIDAIEWVEMPNTRGMSQYADGGIVGTKPYVSAAAYINKMSHYCSSCYYNPKVKVGERACPLNSLFWHFYHRHRALLERHPRIGFVYRNWDKMDAARQQALLAQAEEYLTRLNTL